MGGRRACGGGACGQCFAGVLLQLFLPRACALQRAVDGLRLHASGLFQALGGAARGGAEKHLGGPTQTPTRG